jgi:hypothetical protein
MQILQLLQCQFGTHGALHAASAVVEMTEVNIKAVNKITVFFIFSPPVDFYKIKKWGDPPSIRLCWRFIHFSHPILSL